MGAIYVLIVLLGLVFILKRGMSASIWWVAFFSTAIYALPVAFGRDAFNQEAKVEASMMMLITLLSCLVCALISTRRRVVGIHDEFRPIGSKDRIIPSIFVAASFVAFGSILLIYGSQVFYAHKTESGVGAQFYIFWRLTSTLAVLACLISGRRKLLLLSLLPLFATLFAGDRTAVGITVIASVWMLLQGRRVGAIKTLIILVSAVGLGTFLFFGKTFQAQWVAGTFTSIPDLTRTVLSQGLEAVTRTEPFAIFGVMNALVGFDHSPPDSLLIQIAAQFLILPSFFGFDSSAFNDFFQPILFPGYRERSMAYSFWGEAYVRGGWFGFFAFLSVYLLVLRLFDRLSTRAGLIMRVFAYAAGSYWAFYIHRNSMISILAYERQLILFCLMVFCAWVFLRSFNRQIRLLSRRT